MAEEVFPGMTAHPVSENALEQFVPESAMLRVVQPKAQRRDQFIAQEEIIWQVPAERSITMEPVDSRFWPFMAAALVALGLSTLLVALFAQFDQL